MHTGHSRRPCSRRTSSSSLTVQVQHRLDPAARARPAARPAPRPAASCAGTRPARTRRPRPAGPSARAPARSSPVVRHQRARRPSAAGPRSPSGVPCATASRRMSPVEISGQSPCRGQPASPACPCPRRALRAGRARNATSSGGRGCRPPLHETVVVPHQQVRLDLLQRVERHAHDDQQARAAEVGTGMR